MVVIDTDVVLLAFAFQNDRRQPINTAFLKRVQPGAISFRAEIFDRPYARMKMHRMAFMDALVLNLAERTPGVEQFVTWNARHFKEKSTLTTLTPEEYLDHIA